MNYSHTKMIEPSIEVEDPLAPDNWDKTTPTKTGRHSNVDLSGMRFDKWLVLSPESYHEGCGWYWNCRCDCGKEKAVSQRFLLDGKSKSCGCNRRENMKNVRKARTGKRSTRRVDLTGQRFGRWTVLGKAEHEVGKHPYWECQCDCGTIKAVSNSSLTQGKSRSCGCMRVDMQTRRVYFGEYFPEDAKEKWTRNHKKE